MTTQRTAKEILEELQTSRTKFAELASAPQSTQGQVQEAASVVKALTKELDEFVTQGTDKCDCDNPPMGMLKTPGYYDPAKGVDVPPVWEVGCTFCAPVLVPREDGKALVIEGETQKMKRRSRSARATTPEEAVRKWNAKEWVEDFYFDRIPGFTPEFASE
jgi:hypothetical protein